MTKEEFEAVWEKAYKAGYEAAMKEKANNNAVPVYVPVPVVPQPVWYKYEITC